MDDMYRVAVIGSDEDILNDEEKARLYPACIKIGQLLVENNCIVFTGGDYGIGANVLQGVYDKKGISVAFFPGEKNILPDGLVKIPICTGMGYGMRDIIMLRAVEAVISIAGGAGTLNELANAYHLHKPILTLQKSGGWSEKLENQYIDSRNKVKITPCDTVEELVDTVIYEIKRYRRFYTISKKIHF